MIVARASWLDEALSLEERLLALALDAAREALQCLPSAMSRSGIKLHLALPTESPDEPIRAEYIAEAFAGVEGGALLYKDTAPVTEGHAGGFLALERAIDDLRSGRASTCLVGGVDSYMAASRLEALDGAGRLHSNSNSWGFTPGEGAGCSLIATGRTASIWGLTPIAEIQAVATARESKLLGTQTVCIGEGLTAAFHSVLGGEERIHHAYCDLNGETYRADEFGFTICRTSERFVEPGRFTAAADCWGDVGAASAPLTLALAAAAWERRYSSGPVILTWASSAHSPLRGAARIRQVVTSKM